MSSSRFPLPLLLVALLLGVPVVLAPGCGSETEVPQVEPPETPPPATGWTHEIGPMGASYYLDSPMQGRPPEGAFAGGTKVRIVSEHGGYVRVESETGITAAVSPDALKKREP